MNGPKSGNMMVQNVDGLWHLADSAWSTVQKVDELYGYFEKNIFGILSVIRSDC